TATVRDDHGKEPIHSAAKPAEISAPVTAASVVKDEDEKHSRGAVTSRKPVDAHSVKPSSKETADTKPAAKESGDAKPTPKETADAKPTPKEAANAKARELEAVEEQIRAALANVDASRTPASNSPTLPAETPAPQTTA